MRLRLLLKTLFKSVLLICVLILITLFTNSCTDSKDYSQSNEKQKTKLRFISSWGGVDTKSDLLNQIFKEYMEKYPNVEIINESLNGDDFLPKIKTDFASGCDPDVFGLWPGSDIRALIKAGKVAELTDLLNTEKKWKSSFMDNAWNYTTDNGRIYGLPYEIIFEGLFINSDLFDKYNVKVPENYEDLKEAIKTFRANKIIPIAYNTKEAEGTFLYQNILASVGGKYGVENYFVGDKIRYCYVKAMNYMKELYDMKAFPCREYDTVDALTLSNEDRNALFLDKKAAMIAQGSWFIGDIDIPSNESVDIIPFPDMEGGYSEKRPIIYGFGCGTFFISKVAWDDKEKQEASINLLKEITSEKWIREFSNKGMICNTTEGMLSINYNRLRRTGLSLIGNAGELVGPPDSFISRTGWEEWIVDQFPYVLRGEKKAEDIWNIYMQKYEHSN